MEEWRGMEECGGMLRAKPSRRTREKSSSSRGAQDEKFAAG